MTPSRAWDGATYDRIAAPQEQWGREVLQRLPLTGDETVLDLGCGSGRVTELLLERLPRGHVVGVDGSASMLDAARERLPADRTTLLHQDLLALHVDAPADAAISTATFHWIQDHDTLFARVHAALRPGARFVAQCGGAGNVHAVHAAAEGTGLLPPDWGGAWHFADAETTDARLRAAGFRDVRTWLHDAPVEPPEPRQFLRTVCLGAHLEQLPPDRHDELVDAVFARLGGEALTLHYVRLNIEATA